MRTPRPVASTPSRRGGPAGAIGRAGRQAGRAAVPLAAVASLALAVGCQLVAVIDPRDPIVGLPPGETTRTTPVTIPVEVFFVRCDEHDPLLREELWSILDEQALPTPLRHALTANGLRAGVVSGDLPAHLEQRITLPAAAGDPLPADAAVVRRALRLLPGKRSEIVAATGLDGLVVLERRDGDVTGTTFADATALVALQAWPAEDGRVRLRAVPEIKHGPVVKSWVGAEGSFRLETGQRRHRLDHLQIDVTLPAGGMLLVGCAGDDAQSVGDALLRERDRDERTTMRLLAIRPQSRTNDPAFAPPDAAAGEPDESTDGDRPADHDR